MEYKDYYQTLGVERKADEKEIKKAFRKLAQQYHPDKNPGDATAEQKFKEINEAYTVLSDAEKRSQYDRFGSQWERYAQTGGQADDFFRQYAGGGGNAGNAGGRTRTVSPEEFAQMFGGGGGGGDFSNFFDMLFGGRGGAGFGGRTRSGGSRYGFNPAETATDSPFGGSYSYSPQPEPQRLRRENVTAQITLEEALHGTTRTLQSEDGGRLEVDIPPGVRDGSRVRMSGAGSQLSGTDSDIYLRIQVKPHERITRSTERPENLSVTVPVDLYTAVLGGEVQVLTLERSVVLTIPAGTQSGKRIRLRGLGMPRLREPDKRGDLYAEIQVETPTELSDAERQHFEALRDVQR